jgi:hypothetical protein
MNRRIPRYCGIAAIFFLFVSGLCFHHSIEMGGRLKVAERRLDADELREYKRTGLLYWRVSFVFLGMSVLAYVARIYSSVKQRG